MMKTTKKVLSGTLWLGRGAATMMGLVVILAVVLGVARGALAGTGVADQRRLVGVGLRGLRRRAVALRVV